MNNMFQKYMPEKEWLLKQVTIDDIENELFNYISKIGANSDNFKVRINQSLDELRAKIEDNDEIWSYNSGRNSFVSLSGRSGYCIVRNNEIVINFQTFVS